MGENVEIVISTDPTVYSSSSPNRRHIGWLDTMITMGETKEESQLNGLRMPRVPSTFREIDKNKDCYHPSVVSIGPYHHQEKEERFKEMEERKLTLAHQFVRDSGMDHAEMYCKVEKLFISHAKDCYIKDGPTQFDEEQFAKMMFLDGCFVLQFLYCLYHHPEDLKMASHKVALVARDLFLLENQLPFEVLDTLMKLRFKDRPEQGMELFEAFFKHIRAVPPRRESCREKIIKHLATAKEHFRKLFGLSSSEEPRNSEHSQRRPSHLLELFHMRFVGSREVQRAPADKTSWYRDDSRKTWSGRYYPAEELRNVGIHFKPSQTSLFTDVKYRSTALAGRLYIPPLSIDDSTKSLLLNLVAYEACQGTPSGWITSYVCFMDSLIDHPEDVKELRSKGILLSTLGSDQQVAEFFNDIANYLVPNPYAYIKVKSLVESHYRSTFKRWILHYKGPISTTVVKYSFLYTIIIGAIKAYASVVPANPVFGVCRMPTTNATHYP